MSKILFVEDSSDLHPIVQEALSPEHQVVCAGNLSEAERMLNSEAWDLLLVDILLEDGSGLDLAANSNDLPFMVLSGRMDIETKVQGFELGAEDYITKPFDTRELKARVNARLKARQNPNTSNAYFRFEVPLQRAFLKTDSGEIPLHLTPIEFKMLYYFCTNAPRIIHRNEILNVVWGQGINVLQRTIDKHVSSLRQKLGSGAYLIETIPQSGYRFKNCPT